jgi:hypothetical protein
MMSSTEGSAAGVLEGRSGAPGGGGDRPRIVVIPFPGDQRQVSEEQTSERREEGKERVLGGSVVDERKHKTDLAEFQRNEEELRMRVNEMVARHGRYDRQRFHAAKTKVELQKDLANSDFVIRTDWSSVTGWNQETWRTLPNLWPFVDYVVMADSGRIVDEVPAPLRGTHAKCVTMILLSLLQYGKKEDEEPLKAWALYFLYVTMCLQKDVVKGAKPDRLSWQQETVRRMQMFLNGRWEELLVETLGRIRWIRHAREEAELKAPSQPPIDQKRKINAAAFWTNMKKGRTKAA